MFFFFKQKTAYDMRISDWSSDVCSSDLIAVIACSFALGAAIDKTGVADIVAGVLGAWAGADPFWTLVLLYVVTVLFTELLTNNAAAVLTFTLGLAPAQKTGGEPYSLRHGVMDGARAGFSRPICFN